MTRTVCLIHILTFNGGAPPDPALYGQMPMVSLTGEDGKVRRFQVGWNGSPSELNGMPYGAH
jgi:hypothetical protein